ncbi:hypothetical protein AFERRI_150012 [Acidithiobacillus ferrivorans]|uniref:Uncharacterized protein n=1 Tax=Acidithiobacillus ferrivorans TaxID=160808 RepID=A0A060UK38_9PROT|nr:hypothetical protein AFERRI_150012 [Acidithiobacillus ferrivorans]
MAPKHKNLVSRVMSNHNSNVHSAAFAVIQKLVGSTQNRPVTFTAHRKNRQVDAQIQGHKWPQKCHETEASQNLLFLKRGFRLVGQAALFYVFSVADKIGVTCCL